MKRLLTVAAMAEIATGVALLTVPSWVGRLLLGEDLIGIAATMSRVTGIALIALGIACGPGTPLAGMLTYSAAVALYLAWIGYTTGSAGPMLWPAVALHAILTVLMARETTRRK